MASHILAEITQENSGRLSFLAEVPAKVTDPEVYQKLLAKAKGLIQAGDTQAIRAFFAKQNLQEEIPKPDNKTGNSLRL